MNTENARRRFSDSDALDGTDWAGRDEVEAERERLDAMHGPSAIPDPVCFLGPVYGYLF
jgi:hypothetical protein